MVFANLLSNMRLGVVSRMFTFRPRELPGEQVGLRQEETLSPGEEESALEPEASLLKGENGEVGEMEEEETEQVVQQGSAQQSSGRPGSPANVSRSQKRRRRRR